MPSEKYKYGENVEYCANVGYCASKYAPAYVCQQSEWGGWSICNNKCKISKDLSYFRKHIRAGSHLSEQDESGTNEPADHVKDSPQQNNGKENTRFLW